LSESQKAQRTQKTLKRGCRVGMHVYTCRPAGAYSFSVLGCYTPVAPLGLGRCVVLVAIHLSPRWGWMWFGTI